MNRIYLTVCLILGLVIFSGADVMGQALGHGGAGYSSYSGSNVSGGGTSHTATNPGGLTHDNIVQILTIAAPHFGVSFEVLYDAWRRGYVEIDKIRGDVYSVAYGGNVIILVVDFGIFG